jgi:mono/diheme cytochrome c family protein
LKGDFVIFPRVTVASILLITVCILSFPPLSGADQTIYDLVLLDDAVKCKACHKRKAVQWPESAHSGSVSDTRTLQALKNFIASGQNDSYLTAGEKLRENCLSCHAPQVKNASDKLLEEISGLIVTAVDHEDSPEGKSARQELSKISIDCIVCHMTSGMPEGEVEPKIIYGPGWDEDEESHKRDHGFGTVGSQYLMSSKMCTGCHHAWPPETSFTVTSLHKNYEQHLNEADSSNKTCQSCHMMDGKMIIHNMPRYAGTPGFNVEQTADKIGTGLAAFTLVIILLHGLCRAIPARKTRKSKKDVVPCDREELKLPVRAEAECSHQGADDIEGRHSIES